MIYAICQEVLKSDKIKRTKGYLLERQRKFSFFSPSVCSVLPTPRPVKGRGSGREKKKKRKKSFPIVGDPTKRCYLVQELVGGRGVVFWKCCYPILAGGGFSS